MQMTTDFKINFGGDSHEIDLNTLLTSLLGFSGAIQEIQQQVAPDAKVDIKIRAPERGSFIIDLLMSIPDTAAATAAVLFAMQQGINMVENILSIFANTIELKKHLQGEPAAAIVPNEDGLTVKVENSRGDVIIMQQPVVNLYVGNNKIDGLLSKAFSAINKDEGVEDVTITSHDGAILANVENDDFEVMAQPGLAVEPAQRKTILKESVHVQAYRLSFDDPQKWGFVYEGGKITAHISDTAFLKAIEANEPFAKGDRLQVDLAIEQEFDPAIQAYLNRRFNIVRVLKHLRAEQQGKMFEEE